MKNKKSNSDTDQEKPKPKDGTSKAGTAREVSEREVGSKLHIQTIDGSPRRRRGASPELRPMSIAIVYFTFEEATSFIRENGIVTKVGYKKLAQKTLSLPKDPSIHYGLEWQGWEFFFGIETPYGTLEECQTAARALGIKGRVEYEIRRREDRKLPADPGLIYKSFPGYAVFLGLLDVPYDTYEEASNAAIQLGIKTSSAYYMKRKQDPRLVVSPSRYYSNKWSGWPHFLNTAQDRSHSRVVSEDKYETYDQFKKAVQTLGIKTQSEYWKRYQEDPELPYSPHLVYADEWEGWGRAMAGRRSYLCATWQEAKAIALPYNFVSRSEYENGYRDDDRLPSSPDKKFHDFPGWNDFLLPDPIDSLNNVKLAIQILKIKSEEEYDLARYRYSTLPEHPDLLFCSEWVNWYEACGLPEPYTYYELQEIVQINKCQTYNDYRKLWTRLKDPRMPFMPSKHYQEYTDLFAFLGTEPPYLLSNVSGISTGWVEDIKFYIKNLHAKNRREFTLCKFLRHYVEPADMGKNVQEFLTRKSIDTRTFCDWLDTYEDPIVRRQMCFEINDYLNDALRRLFTDEDETTGEVVRVVGAMNPLAALEIDGTTSRHNETVKPALAYQYVEAIKNWIVPESAKSFSDLKNIQQFDGDYFQVDQALIDFNDPNCIYRNSGNKYYLWYPGNWMALYTLVSVPARGRQIMYNDSGEADEYLVEIVNGNPVLIFNTGPLAQKGKQEGFVCQASDGGWGMHFTSNKTSYEGAGYDVSWIPEQLIFWMCTLREWQRKYNSITRPKPWSECSKRTNLSAKKLQLKGANCFLFRGFGEEQPPIFANLMTHRLAAALYFTQPKGLNLASFNGNDKYSILTRYSSRFTPHSMRVSLITAYVMDFGMPVEIVMKIVGHSSIVMSIYYVKIGAAKMRKLMTEGEKRALLNQAIDAQIMLEQNRLDEMTSQMVANNSEALEALMSGKTGTQLVRDYGICPYAGSRCEDGGLKLASSSWAPVPAGHLGIQNCPRCRHFVTSPVFLGGLVSLWNEISLRVNLCGEKYNELDKQLEQYRAKVQALDYLEMDMEQLGKTFDSRERVKTEAAIRSLQAEMERVAKKMDMFLCDMQAITKLVNDCKVALGQTNLNSSKDESQIQLIVHNQSEFQIEFEETSLFRQLNEVCVNATIYQSASAEFANPRRSQMIDRMASINNIHPVMCHLSEHEQLLLGNQVTNFFFKRLQNWDRIERIMDGQMLLKDLGGEESITTQELIEIFSSHSFGTLNNEDSELNSVFIELEPPKT